MGFLSGSNEAISPAQQVVLNTKANVTDLAAKAPTANPIFTGDVTVEGVTETSPAANTPIINLAVGTVFNYTVATAITLPTVAAGKSFTVVCAVPPTWWTGTVTWTGGTAPAPTAAKGCVSVFTANADATAWYGVMSVDNL